MSAVVIKIKKEEFRAVVKHYYLKKWTVEQIKAELDKVHEDTAPTLNTVYFWINEFKRGRMSSKDEARPWKSSWSDCARKD